MWIMGRLLLRLCRLFVFTAWAVLGGIVGSQLHVSVPAHLRHGLVLIQALVDKHWTAVQQFLLG